MKHFEKTVTFRLSDQEVSSLHVIAKTKGIKRSALIRKIVKNYIDAYNI